MVSDKRGSTSWNESLLVNGQMVIFKVNTGAEVSVITEETVNCLTRNAELERRSTTKRVIRANKTPLDVKCDSCLTYINRSVQQTVYVVKGITGVACNQSTENTCKRGSHPKDYTRAVLFLVYGSRNPSGGIQNRAETRYKAFRLIYPTERPLPTKSESPERTG